jgi:uncharacterized membrane protein
MDAGKAYFDLVLRPNRSMDPRVFWWVVTGVAGLFLLMALRFVYLGAWPVLPFLVIDVALMAWAMRASYRAGAAAEYVRLDDARLTVRKVTAQGLERRYGLEPYFARVELERLPDDTNRLWVSSRGRRVLVGQFLSPPERVAVADVMRAGLAELRGR